MRKYFATLTLFLLYIIGFSQSNEIWGWEIDYQYSFEEIKSNVPYNSQILSDDEDFKDDRVFKYKLENDIEYELEFQNNSTYITNITVSNFASFRDANSLLSPLIKQFGTPKYGYEVRNTSSMVNLTQTTYNYTYYYKKNNDRIIFSLLGGNGQFLISYHKDELNEWYKIPEGSPANDYNYKNQILNLPNEKRVRTLLNYWPK
jgi:hypothetical protein